MVLGPSICQGPQLHAETVQRLQEEMKKLFRENARAPLSLRYRSGHSNTVRSKSYKKDSISFDIGPLDRIVQIDTERKVAIVEPRVTMQKLAKALAPYSLIPAVLPEFKGITVGGAIMGGAAESGSHRYGIFSDLCSSYEVLCGDGKVVNASLEENSGLFHGLPGSYGSLGALLSASIKLIPAGRFVHVKYHVFTHPAEALLRLQSLARKADAPDFLDGIVFSPDHTVIMEGRMLQERGGLPLFSLHRPFAPWYYMHARDVGTYEEAMRLEDYLFRYDQGAFWMGSYLFRLPLLLRLVKQGILRWGKKAPETFSAQEVKEFCRVRDPSVFWKEILHPYFTSQRLWKLFHKAEKWLQERVVVQDFCIPESRAACFLQETLQDAGTLPLWLCPIKGMRGPRLFSPNLLPERCSDTHFINIGIYGLPSHYEPIEEITRRLERKTEGCGGRKVLYSRSYYSEDEFWRIYQRGAYEELRAKTAAEGVWHGVTDKVLSA